MTSRLSSSGRMGRGCDWCIKSKDVHFYGERYLCQRDGSQDQEMAVRIISDGDAPVVLAQGWFGATNETTTWTHPPMTEDEMYDLEG
ncbi:MAG: hypothetical protein LBG99_08085 [Propionibacteriaceae bacterium]|nr:hypothetical protein [Propionibacteriaceae bacterium]